MNRKSCLSKLCLFISASIIFISSISQKSNCPLPPLPDSIKCKTPPRIGAYYSKNVVTDFGADPSGKKNSQFAFECAARFFNLNGGNGKLIIPFGKYLVGVQMFIDGNTRECVNWPDYGWVGRDLMHLVECDNLEIIGEAVNGKLPTIMYRDSIKMGGFKKNGMISNYKRTEGNNYYKLPANCTESQNADTYQANAGATIYINNCKNIAVSNLNIDGNSRSTVLGCFVGAGPAPYEVWSYGVVIWNSKLASLNNMKITDIGTDGILIKNFTDNGLATESYNIKLNKLEVTLCGRNNISWIGGNGVSLTNSSLSRASTGKIKTNPGASFDIEPEIHAKAINRCESFLENGKHIIINDYCVNGVVKNTTMFEDRLFGLLNADRGGYAKNIKISSVKIVNSNARTFYSPKENSLVFENSTLIGKWVINELMMPNIKNDKKIRKSVFKEK